MFVDWRKSKLTRVEVIFFILDRQMAVGHYCRILVSLEAYLGDKKCKIRSKEFDISGKGRPQIIFSFYDVISMIDGVVCSLWKDVF